MRREARNLGQVADGDICANLPATFVIECGGALPTFLASPVEPFRLMVMISG